MYDILLFPTSEEKKKSTKIHFQRGCATQSYDASTIYLLREIPPSNPEKKIFCKNTQRHTFSQNIDQRNLYFRMMGRESIPGSQKVILYRRTNIALKLVLEFLTRLTTHGISARIFR